MDSKFDKYIKNAERLEFQLEDVALFLKAKYFCCGNEMGLGKTLTGIMASLFLGKKTLVICPAGLRLTWYTEFLKFAKKEICIHIFDDAETDFFYPIDTDVIITSYNNLAMCEDLFEWSDFVIADEVQYLKNMESTRGMLFHTYLYEQQPEYFLALSGTPIENYVTEWYSILNLLSYSETSNNGIDVQKLFPMWDLFAEKFCFREMKCIGKDKKGDRLYAYKYRGLRNKKRLKELLKGKYVRRLAKDYLDLPQLNRQNVIVSYSDDWALQEAWDNHKAGTEVGSSAKAKSALVKASFTVRYCKDLYKQRRSPIVIFTDHLKSAAKIAKQLKCPIIDGNVSMKKRHGIVAEFQKGLHKYVVLTIGAGQVGLTLTAARDLVFNDRSWVPGKNWQATCRFYRKTQTRECMVHNMIGSKQDEHIQELNYEKELALKEAM